MAQQSNIYNTNGFLMEIRVLRYFLAVVREQNISRAAESLHLTQPTLSRQIAELESEIGQPLFERGRHLALTEAGVMLRHRAEEAVALVDRIEADFRQREDVGGTLAIGSGVYAAGTELIRGLEEFSLQYPKVQYEIYVIQHVTLSSDQTKIATKFDQPFSVYPYW